MALDNGFIQLEESTAPGRFPTGFFPAVPDAPLAVAGADSSGFPTTPPAHFPNMHPFWGLPRFSQLPDVAERSYEQNADSGIFAVVPSDTALLPTPVSQFYIGGSGDVKFETEAGEVITMANMAEGVNYAFTFTVYKIFATGTTATGIVGIY